MSHQRQSGGARGYTTGACAQAAVRAAGLSLAGGPFPSDSDAAISPGATLKNPVAVVLPGGEEAVFEATIHAAGLCSVTKDAGDDPDITDGVEVFARLEPRRDGRFAVKAGEGVGRVTLPGLSIKPGRPAINPVPLKEVRREASRLLPGGASITVSIPGGEELAARTFNPRLGILGGLSILGTTGRVEPWSTRAYQESLLPQLDVALAAGIKRPALVPGAKGEKAALRLGFEAEEIIQAGNFFGMMLAAAAARGYRKLALVGHASKIAKIARGDFDTHSRRSGAPLDVLADCARAAGLGEDREQQLRLMPTTEQALRDLRAAGETAVLDEAARRAGAMVRETYGLSAEIFLTDGAGEVVGHA